MRIPQYNYFNAKNEVKGMVLSVNTEAVFVSDVKSRRELLRATLTKIGEGCLSRKYVVKKELHYYISGSIENILADENMRQMEIGGYKEEYCGETEGEINCLLIKERGDGAGVLAHHENDGFQFAFFPVITSEMAIQRKAAEKQLSDLIPSSNGILVEKSGRYIPLSEVLAEVRGLFDS